MLNVQRSPKVLVVENDADQRLFFSMIITQMGIPAVQSAASISTAVSALTNTRFDIMLCDYRLGAEETAEDLLDQVLERRAKSSVLITGYNFPRPPPGFDLVLTKPIDPRRLQRTINSLWQRVNSSYVPVTT